MAQPDLDQPYRHGLAWRQPEFCRPTSSLDLELCCTGQMVGCVHAQDLQDAAGCSSLLALPDSLCQLQRLRQLDLCGCTALRTLPEDIGSLLSLEWLDLTRCRSLTTLPASTAHLGGCLLSYAHN